jgi:hypothetical protein
MAFSNGTKSTEGAVRKLYKGVGSFFILGVNPTKSEQEKLFNTILEKEPEYFGEAEVDGKKIKTVRISFVVKADGTKHVDAEGNPIEFTTNHTFFLRNEPRKGSNSGKYQIVDAYGNFAWADEETIKAKAIPQYSNGPASIHEGYRLAYTGEQELTEFLIKYMGIPSPFKWADGRTTGWADNLSDCEARLEHIADYFKGDFSELRSIIAMQPNNKVKLAVGVKTSNDGKQYQATYTNMCLSNSASNFNKLDADIKDRTSSSANPVDYTGDNNKSMLTSLSEYVVMATTFTSEPNGAMPFTQDNSMNDFPF